jgi:hypothetical protein
MPEAAELEKLKKRSFGKRNQMRLQGREAWKFGKRNQFVAAVVVVAVKSPVFPSGSRLRGRSMSGKIFGR